MLAGAAAAVAGGAGFFAGRRLRPDMRRVDWKPPALSGTAGETAAGPPAYLTEEMCRRELKVRTLDAHQPCQVVAYNFPAWHPSPFMEKALGRGWTEWDLARKARAVFPGHLQPKQPLWGYFNEADPKWSAREIDAAAGHGIDCWMIDWYWHDGTQFYHEQLEKGFLGAPNCSRLRFALMWANHDWLDVYPAASPGEAKMLLPQTHSEADCVRVIDYCIEHYFSQPNYWRLGGGLVFGIFDVGLFAERLGGADSLARAIEKMRARVQRAGLGELHIQSNNVHGRLETKFRKVGIDSATYYHTFGWSYGGRAPGGVSPYSDGAMHSIRQWVRMSGRCDVPFFPDCPVGWDDSPRFGASAHMVVGRSPDQYELLLRSARRYLETHLAPEAPRVVYLSSWNEWTEDHVLLPDMVYGWSYLDAVRRVFGGAAPGGGAA